MPLFHSPEAIANASTTISVQGDGTLLATMNARTSGSTTLWATNAAADTGMAIAELNDIVWNLARTVTFTTGGGTIATQRAVRLQAPTYATAVGGGNAITLTEAATFSVDGAPSAGANVTITNPFAARFGEAVNIVSTSANALVVGRQGYTSPVLQVDASAATVVTGLKLTGAAAGAGFAAAVVGGNASENMTLNAKGAGTLTLQGVATGLVNINNGLAVIGANSSINASSNFNTNINTGTSTGAVAIGNASAGAVTVASGAASTLTITGGSWTMATTGANNIALNPGAGGAVTIAPTAVAGGASLLIMTPAAHTAVTAEVIDINFAAHTLAITGSYATQRSVVLGATTFSGAFTVTTAIGLQVNGPLPGTSTLTNTVGVDVPTWTTNGTTASGIRIAAPTGAGTNWAVNVTSGSSNFQPVTLTTLTATTINAFTLAGNITGSGSPTIGTVGAITSNGLLTSVGVTAGAGLIQGTLGLTITGAAASLNASSNFATNINTGTSTGAVTIGNSAAGVITIANKSNTAATFLVTDGTNNQYALDTRTGVTGVSTHTFSNTAPSFASAAGNTYSLVNIPAYTITQTGVTGITALNGLGLVVGSPTVTNTSAGLTITTASTAVVNGPLPTGNATFTNSIALDLPTFVTNGTTASGVRVAAPTGAGTNWAINVTSGSSNFQAITAGNTLTVTTGGASVTASSQTAFSAVSTSVGTFGGIIIQHNKASGAPVISLQDNSGEFAYFYAQRSGYFHFVNIPMSIETAATSGGVTALTVTQGAHTAVVAEQSAITLAAHTVAITGAIATFRDTVLNSMTFSGAFTVTTAVGLQVNGPLPGTSTLTNTVGVDIPTWATNGTTASGIRVAAPTGAGTNWAINVTSGSSNFQPVTLTTLTATTINAFTLAGNITGSGSPTIGTVGAITSNGLLTSVGVTAGAGLIQGTLGLTITGAAVSLNASSNFATNINTGTSTGAVTIGNSASGTLALNNSITVTAPSLAAATAPAGFFIGTDVITGAVTDAYTGGVRITPTINAATAQTVTRYNYIDLVNVTLGGAGPAALTDAAALRFSAIPGTHSALAADGVVATVMSSLGPTGAQTTIQGWIKINVAGTLRYVPFW